MRIGGDGADGGRYEYKYLVHQSMRDKILDFADAWCLPDPNGKPMPMGTRGYTVHSIYFDTPLLNDYQDRLESRRIRVRLRARTYGKPGDGAPVFLEDKRKVDNWVVKQRVRICDAESWAATPHERPWVYWAERVKGRGVMAARHFVRRMEDEARIPVSIVHYDREVFVGRRKEQKEVRLTLDHNISATISPGNKELYNPPDVALFPEDWIVLELKFAGDRPGWMRKLCGELHLVSEAVSKFGMSVAKGVRGAAAADVRFFTPRSLRRAEGRA